MSMKKAQLHQRYPVSSILVYNGVTILHFTLGGAGFVWGYASWGWISNTIGFAYLLFAFGEMYLWMPFKVCPNCVYFHFKNSLCISGLNIVSRRWASAGKVEHFGERAKGLFCSNNFYMAALLIPIIALIPALLIDFSWRVLTLLGVLIGLLVFRFLVIFPKLACLHCRAKFQCPQAGKMGVRDL